MMDKNGYLINDVGKISYLCRKLIGFMFYR